MYPCLEKVLTKTMMGEETAQIMCSQMDANIKRVKVAREYCLPEYPKEILEMGLR